MSNYVSIGECRLCFERQGHGEPLLLIPGLGAGTWLWAKNQAHWSKHFDLVMPELRGSGRSDKPDQRYAIAQFATDMNALLDHLRLDKAHLLGASLGGFVAQYLAAQWPERVHKLVLVATSLGGQCQIEPKGEILSRIIRPRGKSRRERLEDAYALNFTAEFMARHPEELERITAWRMANAQPEHIYYRQLLAGNAYGGTAWASKITAPTLICTGKEDEMVVPENADILQKAIPHAQTVIFEGKHMFFFEYYRKFNQVVVDFLNGSFMRDS
jgi:pimeloyl-ACP methyl ester carboxylesterase